MPKEQVLDIAKSSYLAYQKWKNAGYDEKAELLKKFGEVLRKNKEEYGKLMTIEMGKPIREAVAEVEKCAGLADVLAEKGKGWLKEETADAGGKNHLIVFEPIGPIFITMPWNFPFWQALKVGLAPLLAGNTIILKHAKNVTGCSLAIEEAFRKAGFPENVFRSIILDHSTTPVLIASDYVAAVSLTGSVGAGAIIAGEAGKNVKKSVMELGGSDPLIVLDDADIEIAAKGAVLGRTFNSGQVCIAAKRIIVMKKVADDFTKKFAELMSKLKVGDPLNPENNVGPLADKKAVDEMQAFVDDAVNKGGKVLAGGKRKEGKGYFFEPTVLSQTNDKMNAVCKEVFGPIAPVIIVDTEEEAITAANDSEFGLSGSVWTKDLKRGEKVARKIEAGSVFVNSISRSHALLPLGGIKKSGYGRELSHYGIKEFVNIKTINLYEHK